MRRLTNPPLGDKNGGLTNPPLGDDGGGCPVLRWATKNGARPTADRGHAGGLRDRRRGGPADDPA
eukprot:6021160-Heterocapsa_arctica.AAC.1